MVFRHRQRCLIGIHLLDPWCLLQRKERAVMGEAEKFVVRLWDGFDGIWMDVSDPVSKEEADRIWNEKTEDGTKKTNYDDIDYYAIYPADTKMRFVSGNSQYGRDV